MAPSWGRGLFHWVLDLAPNKAPNLAPNGTNQPHWSLSRSRHERQSTMIADPRSRNGGGDGGGGVGVGVGRGWVEGMMEGGGRKKTEDRSFLGRSWLRRGNRPKRDRERREEREREKERRGEEEGEGEGEGDQKDEEMQSGD